MQPNWKASIPELQRIGRIGNASTAAKIMLNEIIVLINVKLISSTDLLKK